MQFLVDNPRVESTDVEPAAGQDVVGPTRSWTYHDALDVWEEAVAEQRRAEAAAYFAELEAERG